MDNLKELKELLTEAETNDSPLRKILALTKLSQEAMKVRMQWAKGANDEYSKLAENNKGRVLVESIAMLSSYTPRSRWEYPVELTAQIKQLQIQAQADGTAKKSTPEAVDPNKSLVFQISFIDSFISER